MLYSYKVRKTKPKKKKGNKQNGQRVSRARKMIVLHVTTVGFVPRYLHMLS